MICVSCGQKNGEGKNFCSHCGYFLKSEIRMNFERIRQKGETSFITRKKSF